MLNFFLLILKIFFNFIPDIVYKSNRFSNVFFQTGFELVLGQKIKFPILDYSFLLLLM